MMTITRATDLSAPGCDLIRQWLREHNREVNPTFMELLGQAAHQAQPLILLNHSGPDVTGGLFAETQLSWLRISIMAVAPEHRSKGIGTALLEEAESVAIARGCTQAYVDTMEYQASRFYLAHGFTIVGEIADWDSHGHRKLHLTKRLA
jgi:GNAT superfamily N-acetyltransferase